MRTKKIAILCRYFLHIATQARAWEIWEIHVGEYICTTLRCVHDFTSVYGTLLVTASNISSRSLDNI